MVGAISRPFSGPHFHTILQHFFRPFCDPVFAHALVGDAGSRRPASERLSARASTHSHTHTPPGASRLAGVSRAVPQFRLHLGPPLCRGCRRCRRCRGPLVPRVPRVTQVLRMPQVPRVPRVPQLPQVSQVPQEPRAAGAAGAAGDAGAADAAGAAGAEGAAVGFADPRSQGVQDRTR